MAFLPLQLDLDPIVPVRARLRTPRFGYALRLADGGPRIADDDELLALHGAVVSDVETYERDEETLQDDAFLPGCDLRLVEEPTSADPDAIGVWDASATRRGGELDYETSRRVMAAADHGVELRAVVLSERRTNDADDRRAAVSIVVAPAALVHIGDGGGFDVVAPRRPARRRVVLVADQSGDLHFWDAARTGGPLELDELPLSDDFVRLFGVMRERLCAQADAVDAALVSNDCSDRFELWMETDATREDMRGLWLRARAELGTRFLVGYQEPGVQSRSWSPYVDDDSNDDIPF